MIRFLKTSCTAAFAKQLLVLASVQGCSQACMCMRAMHAMDKHLGRAAREKGAHWLQGDIFRRTRRSPAPPASPDQPAQVRAEPPSVLMCVPSLARCCRTASRFHSACNAWSSTRDDAILAAQCEDSASVEFESCLARPLASPAQLCDVVTVDIFHLLQNNLQSAAALAFTATCRANRRPNP